MDDFLCFLPVLPMPPLSRGIKEHLQTGARDVSEPDLGTDNESTHWNVWGGSHTQKHGLLQKCMYLWGASAPSSDKTCAQIA